MPPPELKAALDKVWERGWKPAGDQFGDKEFHRLVRLCERLYPGMIAGKNTTPYQEAVENIFLNTPSRWNGNIEQSPEDAAEVLDQAFLQNEWPVTYLMPLDLCPSFPEVVKFGNNEVGEFNRKSLGLHMGEPRLFSHANAAREIGPRKAKEIDAEINRFSYFQWLIVRDIRSFNTFEKRILSGRPGSVGEGFFFGELPQWAESDIVDTYSHRYSFEVERALFALALCPWEDCVDDTGVYWWRPFRERWVYAVSHDPLARMTPLPASSTLSWRSELNIDPESGEERGGEIEYPRQVEYDWARMETLGHDLSNIWKSVNAVWSSKDSAHAGLNRLVPHFLLEAFRAEGIDQLIFHNTTIDAVLSTRTQSEDVKRHPRKIIAELVDSAASDAYSTLYNARSDYIHGRDVRKVLTYSDLRDMRRVTRLIVVRALELLTAHPEWTRRDYLNYLETLQG